jgi:hypothetical protein
MIIKIKQKFATRLRDLFDLALNRTVSSLRTGQLGKQLLAKPRDISLLKTFQTSNGVYPAPCSVGSLLRGYSNRDVRLTTHFHIVHMLRMNLVNYLHRLCLHGMYKDYVTLLPVTESAKKITQPSLIMDVSSIQRHFRINHNCRGQPPYALLLEIREYS